MELWSFESGKVRKEKRTPPGFRSGPEWIVEILAELGDQGWELVTATFISDPRLDGRMGLEIWHFKRPKEGATG
jgi:hypothetical protein